ncbi:hypothetical protein LCGC14_1321910 [marine sediment metagenome]|uniref:Radical SAM core domain-containing protein n=1 Tax=marine sediment metagenome TaxID=412755 RepID=A0A0F9L4Q9_9ZZZZ
MNINLLTDAPKHNLALMKISTHHKAKGDNVQLNGIVGSFDQTYGSWLFTDSQKGVCDIEGGPGIDPTIRLNSLDGVIPDYSLYNLDYSLGYTWAYCPRKCPFCMVPKQNNPEIHRSIWNFHTFDYDTICLLNNNTFSDPNWKDTFEEIWDADLKVRDENGYDLRLLDDEKTDALHRTKWATPLHFAWDFMEDEEKIRRGLGLINKHKMRSTANGVYVLTGFDTTLEEDLHRCQVIDSYGLTPYPMPYRESLEGKSEEEKIKVGKKLKGLMKFKQFINLHYYRKYSSIKEAWLDYDIKTGIS